VKAKDKWKHTKNCSITMTKHTEIAKIHQRCFKRDSAIHKDICTSLNCYLLDILWIFPWNNLKSKTNKKNMY